MKIKVSKLKPNPFRDIKHYPIDQEKIDSLKASIEDTGFWDNLLCRKSGDNYEIAYGHHRLEAVRQMGLTDVDIPVKDLDDETMLRIMANENRSEYQSSPVVIHETVKQVKEYLDAQLAKCEKWTTSDKNIKGLFENQRAFETAKGMGVGRDTIVKFLNAGNDEGRKGSWKAHIVQKALKNIQLPDKEIKALEKLPTMSHVEHFQSASQKYQLTPDEQVKIADTIAKEKVGKRNVEAVVRREIEKKEPERIRYIPKPKLPDVSEFITSLEKKIAALNQDLLALVEVRDQLSDQSIAVLLKTLDIVFKTTEQLKQRKEKDHV